MMVIDQATVDCKVLVKAGTEYESRLFGGAYTMNRMVPKGSPKHRMIKAARTRYNAIRVKLGLPEVIDWSKLPEKLIQHVET